MILAGRVEFVIESIFYSSVAVNYFVLAAILAQNEWKSLAIPTSVIRVVPFLSTSVKMSFRGAAFRDEKSSSNDCGQDFSSKQPSSK